MRQSLIVMIFIVGASALCVERNEPNLANVQQLQRALDHAGKSSTLETGNEILDRDKGFLGCAEMSLAPEFQHGNTQSAFGNLLLKDDPSGDAVIIGHGGPGVLCTGDGDGCSGKDSVTMAFYNPDSWQKIAQELKAGHSNSLTILACDVGQGNNGADFLFALAKSVQRPVRAPDSEVQCGPDGITFPDGGSWVQATPSSRPSPSSMRIYSVDPTNSFKFKVDGKLVSYALNEINVVEFRHRTYRQSEFREFHNVQPSAIIRLIDFGRPFETFGRPAAIVTGVVRVQLISGVKKTEKSFVIYDDELAEDLAEPDVFYHADQLRVMEYVAELDQSHSTTKGISDAKPIQ